MFQDIEFISCLWMIAIVWMVQILHYPSFHFIEGARFKEFALFHQNRISFLVIPAMLVEITSCLSRLVTETPFFWIDRAILWSAAFLLILVWIITFLKAVPLHEKLSKEGYEEVIVDQLIFWNGVRVFLWTIRGFLLGWNLF